MKKILIFLVSLILLTNFHSKAQNCFNADMMILIDWSGSEKGNECALATAASLFVSELPVDENQLRVGVLTFNDYVIDEVPLTGDKNLLLSNIAGIALYGANGGTSIEDALIIAGASLNNERTVPKLIIIISDGEIYDINDAVIQTVALKQYLNLGIFAVQIGGTEDEDGLKNLIRLTGSPNSVEQTLPVELLEALKRLNICG